MNAIVALLRDPVGVFCWLSVGAVAGWLADSVMPERSLGRDVLVGMVAAVVCGFLFGLVDQEPTAFIGSILVAFVGACLLVAVVRLVATGRRLGSDR